MNDFSTTQAMYLSVLLDGGCKFLFKTTLFDKKYVWMETPDGKIFLERIPDDY